MSTKSILLPGPDPPPLDTAAVDEDVERLAHSAFRLGRDNLLDEAFDSRRVREVADYDFRTSPGGADRILRLGVGSVSLCRCRGAGRGRW